MKFIVGIVKPPFSINIDEFTLALKEVGMMLGLPTNTCAIVSKRSIGRIPIRNLTTVAAERTESS